jgi:membrane fusion protein, multidrug efflux system
MDTPTTGYPIGLRAAALLVLVFTAAGCKPSAPPGGPPAFPPPLVSVAKVQPRDVEVRYEYVAQTAGYREVEVRARVTGMLLSGATTAKATRVRSGTVAVHDRSRAVQGGARARRGRSRGRRGAAGAGAARARSG